jgi:hypothetical protein
MVSILTPNKWYILNIMDKLPRAITCNLCIIILLLQGMLNRPNYKLQLNQLNHLK